MAKPIPDGYPRVTPYLYVDGAKAAIDFYISVLGAGQRGATMDGPDGRVGHAELTIGESVIMIADGHRWSIATHTEDLTPEEMQQRMGQLPG